MWCHRWSLYSKTLENMTSAIFTLQYSFVFTFTNIFLTIRQDWYCLFKHCLSTQWRPHVRPRAVFSFTNNNPFYHKQSILSGNNTSSVEIIQSSSFEDGPIVIRPEVPTQHYSTVSEIAGGSARPLPPWYKVWVPKGLVKEGLTLFWTRSGIPQFKKPPV